MNNNNIVSIVMTASLALCALTSKAAPKFFLPERLYAAPGSELNVYYRQIFNTVVPNAFAYQCESERGKTELKRWCWTPTADDAGKSFKLVINAWNDDGIAASVTTTVEVAAAPVNPKKKLTFALFGDSIVNSKYQDRILVDMRAAGFENYTPIGANKGVKLHEKDVVADHDGYGGYACDTFLTQYAVSEEEFAHANDQSEREQLLSLGMPVKIVHSWQKQLLRSPLVRFRGGKKVVDVQAWLDDVNGGQPPDVIVIELGGNSIFGYMKKGTTEQIRPLLRANIMPKYTKLISALRTRAPNARFAICTMLLGTNQDGFGVNYGSGWNEIEWRRTAFAMNYEIERYVKEMNDPKLELLPMGHGADPDDGYVYREEKVSAVSDNMVRRNSNGLHPNMAGGKQIGDTIAAWLRVRWNEFTK